jgi:hypothetical protein
MIGPQEIVERTLAAGAHLHGCFVLVSHSSEAVLRWANSTMTTNGHTSAQRVTVVALVGVEGGTAAGVVSSGVAVTDAAQLTDLVRAAEASARDAGPARDAAPLPEPGDTDPSWVEPAQETSIGVFTRLADGSPRCWPARSGSTASPATSWSRPGSARPRGCGGAGCSRPGRWS